jgi:hypothetical protein
MIVPATAGVVVLAAGSGWLVVGLRPGVATGSVISSLGRTPDPR